MEFQNVSDVQFWINNTLPENNQLEISPDFEVIVNTTSICESPGKKLGESNVGEIMKIPVKVVILQEWAKAQIGNNYLVYFSLACNQCAKSEKSIEVRSPTVWGNIKIKVPKANKVNQTEFNIDCTLTKCCLYKTEFRLDDLGIHYLAGNTIIYNNVIASLSHSHKIVRKICLKQQYVSLTFSRSRIYRIEFLYWAL